MAPVSSYLLERYAPRGAADGSRRGPLKAFVTTAAALTLIAGIAPSHAAPRAAPGTIAFASDRDGFL